MHSPTKEAKIKVRREVRTRRNSYSEAALLAEEHLIMKCLENNPTFMNASNILCYWALKDEVNTLPFILKWHLTKNIYLPIIKGDNLQFVLFKGMEHMKEGKYGIAEPTGEPLKTDDLIELMLIPGVAFDKDNNRLGRGAGYYDRILHRFGKALKIGLAYSYQLVDVLPTEHHDVGMDMVLTAEKA